MLEPQGNRSISLPKPAVPIRVDIESGIRAIDQNKDSTPDMGAHMDDNKNILSMQADIISVLSGHSYNRSGTKKIDKDRKMKFGHSRGPMSQSGYQDGNF